MCGLQSSVDWLAVCGHPVHLPTCSGVEAKAWQWVSGSCSVGGHLQVLGWQPLVLEWPQEVQEWQLLDLEEPQEVQEWQPLDLERPQGVQVWQPLDLERPQEVQVW